MVRPGKKIVYARVVIDNFFPIIKELYKAQIAKILPIIIKSWRGYRLIIGCLSGVIAGMIFLFNVNLSYENVDFKFDAGAKIVDFGDLDSGVENDRDLDLFVLDSGRIDLAKQLEEIPAVKEIKKLKQNKKRKQDFWREFFVLKSLARDNFWQKELAQMRYRCNAYWNRWVDVVCLGKDSFCEVIFEVSVDGQRYKVFFRSEVSVNGFDEISKMRVYAWEQDNKKIDEERKRILIDKIIVAKPKCTPFSSD